MPFDPRPASLPLPRPGSGGAAFARTAAASLGRVLGASKAVFVERDAHAPATARSRPDGVHFVDWPAWCKDHYCRHVQRRDPIAHWLASDEVQHEGGVVCLSDLVPARRLPGLPWFETMLRPSGARFVLSVALRDAEGVSGVLSLVRDAGGGDFDAHDRALVRTLAPLLGAAWRGRAGAPAVARSDDARFAALTPREHEILGQVATGHANKEIARRLGVSPWTVKNHLRAIFEKTGVHTRTALCALLLG